MQVKKSYYDMLKYLTKNTTKKATLSLSIGGKDTAICYISYLGIFIDFYVSEYKYTIHQMRMCPDYLDQKTLYLWEVEDLSDLDVRITSDYMYNNDERRVLYEDYFIRGYQ